MADKCPECKRDLPTTTAVLTWPNGVVQKCKTCEKRIKAAAPPE